MGQVAEKKLITITSGSAGSDKIVLNQKTPGAILFPSAMSGSNLKFQVEVDGSYHDMYNRDGTLYQVPFIANGFRSLEIVEFLNFLNLRVVSDATESSDREFYIFSSNII